jgi:hypothetical protein
MADYSGARDLAGRLLLKKGFEISLETPVAGALETPSGGVDPFTGLPVATVEQAPAEEVKPRKVLALKTGVDRKLFEGTTIQQDDDMLLIDGAASVGETWDGRSIIAVQMVDPDNSGPIITKAVVR